jgi:hypothetical protein
MTTTESLKKLPVGKNVVFRTPIECDEVLVRSGIVDEPFSFFHCFLYAYSEEYNSINSKKQSRFVSRLCFNLVFQKNIMELLEKVYSYLFKTYQFDDKKSNVIKKIVGTDEKQFKLSKLIAELIPLQEGFNETIICYSCLNNENKKISIMLDEVINQTHTYINNTKELKSVSREEAEYVCRSAVLFITSIVKEAEIKTLQEYKTFSEDMTNDSNNSIINILAKHFKRDIYFLNKNRIPCNNLNATDNLNNRKSIVVLCMENNHYEIVGKLLPENRIQREFDVTDPIIKKMYTFLTQPEKVNELFPELVDYLPNEYKKQKNKDYQDSSDENDSDENDSDENDSDESDSN